MTAMKTFGLRYTIIPLVLLVCSTLLPCFGQEETSSRFFSTSMGLSQGTNYSMWRDSEQFLWITSEDGINRFDGINFKNYYYDERKSGSPKGISFAGIVEDASKNLWIGSDKALNKYNRSTDSFLHFEDENHQENYNIPFQIKDGQLYYFNANRGILSKDIKTGTVEAVHLFKDYTKYYQSYQYALINTLNQLIFPLDYGIAVVNLTNKKTAYYYSRKKNNSVGEPLVVYCLKTGNDPTQLWLGTKYGLFLLNTRTHQTQHFPLPGNPNDKEIFSMEKSGNQLYLGTAAIGPLAFDMGTKQYTLITTDNDQFKFKGQLVLGAYKDPQGILWFNLNPSGILAVSPDFKKFNKHQLHPINSSNTEVIRSFVQTPDGNIWIGTQGGGIFVRDQKTGTTRSFEEVYSIRQPSLWIRHLLSDPQLNRTFIATEDGLFVFDHTKGLLQSFSVQKKNTNAIFVHHLLNVSDSLLLVGTKTGPYLANKVNSTLKPLPFLRNKNISYLFRDKRGLVYFNIWEASMAIYRYRSNEWDYVKTIFPKFALMAAWQDPSTENLYFATNMGLLETTKDHQLIKQYTSSDGLPNNFIYGILADKQQRLWLSTNKGLAAFNLRKKTFQRFGPKDGLQGYEYNGKAFYQDHNGLFYFGGTDGYDRFDPQMIKDATYPVNSYVKELLINNTRYPFPSYFEKKPLIPLKYDENTFSISLGVTDFLNAGSNLIKYKLENFDREWVTGTANSVIRYTQLPSGKYTFRFLAANRDGYWDKREKNILFQVSTPYYASWWFITLMALGVTVVLYLLYRYRVDQLLRMERLKMRLSNDLHDDVGASLSAINIYTKMAEEKPEKSAYIKLIKANTLQALDSINTMIWAIKPETQRFDSLILKMKDFAIPFLEGQGITCVFIVNHSGPNNSLSPDFTKNLFLLFKESINNIAKHAACSHTYIKMDITKERFALSIDDNGKGFDHGEMNQKGNGLRSMYERCKAFNGDFQIYSQISKGTRLTLSVALKNTTL